MLKWIFDHFYDPSGTFTIIRLFQYITFRAAVSAVIGFGLSIACMPAVIRWCQRSLFRAGNKEDVPFHAQKAGTPILGGAVVVGATIIAALICADLANGFVQIILTVLIGLGLVGLLDDVLKAVRSEAGLFGRYKLLFQLIIGSVIAYWVYHASIEYRLLWVSDYVYKGAEGFQPHLFVPFFKNIHWNIGVWYVPLAVVIIVGASNAVNLTDGLDGLAGGLSIFSIACYAALSYLSGHFFFSQYLQVVNVVGAGEITVILAAMLGGLMGFLWFNAPPAQIFLGDTGSLAIGGLLGTVAILIKQELLLVLVGSIFVLETVSVILQVLSYKFRHKRIFLMSPLHHHFEMSGWAESKIVIRFWILGIVSALMALATLKLR